MKREHEMDILEKEVEVQVNLEVVTNVSVF